jgi:hypothetical protein
MRRWSRRFSSSSLSLRHDPMFKNKSPEFWLIMTLTLIIILCASLCSTRPADTLAPTAVETWT